MKNAIGKNSELSAFSSAADYVISIDKGLEKSSRTRSVIFDRFKAISNNLEVYRDNIDEKFITQSISIKIISQIVDFKNIINNGATDVRIFKGKRNIIGILKCLDVIQAYIIARESKIDREFKNNAEQSKANLSELQKNNIF
jgi:hypothetical protein